MPSGPSARPAAAPVPTSASSTPARARLLPRRDEVLLSPALGVDFAVEPCEIELEGVSGVLLRIGEVEVSEGRLQLGAQSAAVLHLAREALPGRS